MLLSGNPVVDQLLLPSVILFFLTFGAIALAIGIGLIFSTARTLRFFGTMNRYVSTRHAFKPLAVMRDVEEPVQRNRLLFGVLVCAGAAYSLFGLLMRFDADAIVARLGANFPFDFVAWLLETLRWSLIALTAFALAIGIMLVFFPNALRRFEKHANHWYSVRKLTYGMDKMYFTLDKRVAAFPRASGFILVLAALFVVADSIILLSRLHQ
jgi:hypothetical protein